jgi:uncharacterized membrane protein
LPQDQLHSVITWVARLIELTGVAIILVGIGVAAVIFVAEGRRGDSWRSAYEGFRANLGRGILLGLELLVAADIIWTVTAPLTITSVGLLAMIVLIRTFLSFALETEIEGRWPWRRAEGRDDNHERGPR